MEKKRLVLYGEKTVLLKTRRVPESKKDELEKMIDDFLLKCVNPGYVKSDVYLSDESGVFPFKKDKEENHWKVEKPPKKIEPQVVVDVKKDKVKALQEIYKKPPRKIEIPMTNYEEALEGARILYSKAVHDYNAYIESCGVMLYHSLNPKQQEAIEFLLQRTIVMQDYFKNVLEAKRSFDPSGDE